jgi:S1-C subfamily serine protease
VHNFNELRNQIAGVPTGTKVTVGIQRGNAAETVTAEIVEQPESLPEDSQPQIGGQPGGQPAPNANAGLLAGVHVTEIPADHAGDLPPNTHGVMVSSVDDNCAASGALQQNDVIEEIDRVPIHSVAEYQQVAGAIRGRRALLSICRDRRRSFTVVTGG